MDGHNVALARIRLSELLTTNAALVRSFAVMLVDMDDKTSAFVSLVLTLLVEHAFEGEYLFLFPHLYLFEGAIRERLETTIHLLL